MSTTPKTPRPPKPSGFGAFAGTTAPTAPPPPQAGPAEQPAAPAPEPAPTAGAAGVPPAPETRPGGQLAELLAGGGDDWTRRMMTGPPVDPMLDLVPLGANVPRHYKRALDNAAHVTGRKKQDLIQQALAEFLGGELLARSLPDRR